MVGTDRQLLLATARTSIEHGLEHGGPLPVDVDAYDEALRSFEATFVTLRKAGDLRGCMGSSSPVRALIEDVAHNAFSAGFRDPRFSPLIRDDLTDLEIQISVLSNVEPMSFTSQDDLLAQVRPGLDGLLLQEERHRGMLLPSVWETLPAPEVFLRELKLKAGLTADYWSESIRVSRYTTESFS